MLTAVIVECTVVSGYCAMRVRASAASRVSCPDADRRSGHYSAAGLVPRAAIIATMAERGEGSQETAATSASNRESDVSPTGKTAPIWKYFGFDRKDQKGKSSKAVCKLCWKNVAHAGGTTNLKSHLHTWHTKEYESLFVASDSRPKEQPTLTDYMRPTRVEKLAANCDRTKKLTTAITEFIRESVDSLCRDGTDTPYTQYKIKLSKSLQKITSKVL